MNAVALNLVIATIWLLLSREPSTAVFVIGYVVGYGLIALFRSLVPGGPAYIRRSVALVRFAFFFAWQFLVANFSVAAVVLLRPRDRLAPNYLTYDTSGLTPGEILLLCYCITLTPGTVSIRVSEDRKTLVIHALDAADPEAIRASILRDLQQPIQAFTR